MAKVFQNNKLRSLTIYMVQRNRASPSEHPVVSQSNRTLISWPFPWSRETELRRLNRFHWTDH